MLPCLVPTDHTFSPQDVPIERTHRKQKASHTLMFSKASTRGRHRKPRFLAFCFWGARGVMHVWRPQVVSRDSVCGRSAVAVSRSPGLRPVSAAGRDPVAEPVAAGRTGCRARSLPPVSVFGLRGPPVSPRPETGIRPVAGEPAAGNQDPANRRRRHTRRVDKPGRLGCLLVASQLPVGWPCVPMLPTQVMHSLRLCSVVFY